jgi:hypothetical protein
MRAVRRGRRSSAGSSSTCCRSTPDGRCEVRG